MNDEWCYLIKCAGSGKIKPFCSAKATQNMAFEQAQSAVQLIVIAPSSYVPYAGTK
jgi:hypothetical protein